MSDSYQGPGGEPARPLPPYRPAGPQSGAPGPVPGQTVFSPVPSQSQVAPPAYPQPAAPQPGYGAPAAPAQAAYPAPPAGAPGGQFQPPPARGLDVGPGTLNPGQIAASSLGPAYQSTPTREFDANGNPVAPFVPAQAGPPPTSVAAARAAAAPPAPPAFGAPAGGAPVFLPAAEPAPSAAPEAPAPQQPAATAAAAKPADGRRDRVRSGVGQAAQEGDLPIDEVLTEMVRLNASDVHLTTGSAPMVRISGSLQAIEGFGVMTPDNLRRTIYAILTQKQRETFETNLELDFSYSVRGLARFRVNIYQQRESIGAAFRVIPYEIKELEKLGVPAVVGTFAGLPRGLVLVTGPTGSGKSTTLASIIDLANRTRSDHIMTVEDPIEFLHRHKKSLINQREVGQDTLSFANALKHVLRQDPDIILVGEMRDLETISVALTAAETGHLVFATLHTQDAAQSIDRVIDVFPAHQQAQVRTQLAGAIQGVVCQTLCKRSDQPGRAVATEVLVATPAIRNLIREGKTHQIYSAMQAGAKQGMHTMDQHLAELVKDGKITYEVGLEKCHHIEDYNRLTGRFSGGTQGAAGLGDASAVGAGMGGL
ncbi:type IV pilus twitching motility protein PilT [Cellulomonas alba]|uniref:Type IV pilus twitching motility protein PilT n=1 Tax=Cellulomonas alba TaxID=3053467 RepID=A0ABT7SB72_9CELL|nr:type IV pilus twitching motility protein PilT [Cellulomonas alba]MDM7853415.1 type IV pilus twitching motility protein PilT [Cellulomonas alba]